ncbi:hypothetical protein P3T73_16015 [Kiritimatiellota bacterium B12222]|nr:hypothetical protein P3T73_16015 [Kiritimatiellota bacterium B12222]
MEPDATKTQKSIIWIPVVLVGLILSVLMLRPHGDTFTALDHSGYRLMSVAFSEGRGLHEQDQVLMEVPEELRTSFLLFPHMAYRNTRDRSFLVSSLSDGATEPFFYPLIAVCASGLEAIFPGKGRDFCMPLFGLLFCAVCLSLGAWKGKTLGVLMAGVFCLGSPLPLWLFRGFYVEAAAASIFAAGVWLWMRKPHWIFMATALVGFSAAVHPIFLVMGPPTAVLMLLNPQIDRRQTLLGFCGVLLGVLPLIMMTLWVAAPYGKLEFSQILLSLRVSVPHQLVFGGMLLSLILFLLSLAAGSFRRRVCEKLREPPLRMAMTFLALLPLLVATMFWSEKAIVHRGLYEFWLAIRFPMGILFPLGVWQLHRGTSSLKFFALWALFLFTLPLFTYLKGTEQMGMWSQRRLFPAYTLWVLAVLPLCAGWVEDFSYQFKSRKVGVLVLACLLCFCSFSNFMRWPSPYLVRVEQGALSEMEVIRDDIGTRLAFFDYQPYTYPFAVDNRTRVLGLNDQCLDHLDDIIAWLGDRAATEPVLFVTAYANPGLEDGLQLISEKGYAFEVDRVRGNSLLPAETYASAIRMNFLDAEPVDAASESLMVDKVMDDGFLALRSPWPKTRRTFSENGVDLPADWSQQGSGIVGPIPIPGQAVTIELWAASGQEGSQTLQITPPWEGDRVEIEVPATFQRQEIVLYAPAAMDGEQATGVYRLSSPSPYDPSLEGIDGFPSDLGALIHRIRISRTRSPKPIGN